MAMTVFHPDVYRTDRTAPSYWQATASVRPAPVLDRRIEAEVAVIGGGYAGLSAALHLARDHDVDVVVLEAGDFGWGASGRNGGFATLPAAKMSPAEMARRHGGEAARAFLDGERRGLDLVRTLIAEEAIDCDPAGDANFEVAHHPSAAAGLRAAAADWRRFGFAAEFLDRDDFLAVGHGGTEQFGALKLPGHFGLHPLKYLAGLREAAERRGARLFARSAVLHWERHDGRQILKTAGGEVAARRVLLATNGYTPDGLRPAFDNRTLPALSNIIVTRPLTGGERSAAGWKTDGTVTNARDLLFYYRMLPDGRFLFGARGGVSGTPTEDMRMKAWLVRRLGEVFPAWSAVDIAYFWNGLVCLTARRTPAVGRLEDDPAVYFGFGWHGSGVVAATAAGRLLAGAVATGGEVPAPPPSAGLPPGLLSPLVRRWALRAAYLWYGLRDFQRERL